MVNQTQDIVCSIQGAEELLQKSEEVFHNKEKQIVFIENGFQVHVDGLPYYFQLSCFEEIGWNVFLTSLSGSIEDDEETDIYYHQLEDAIDMVNIKYFHEDTENEVIAYNFFKIKSLTTEKLNQWGKLKEINDTGHYVFKVILQHLEGNPLEIGYSKIFKRWYYEFSSEEVREKLLHDTTFLQYAEELDYVIGNINKDM